MRYHDQCNLAMCHAVPQPVYFTWKCAIRYHNQCIWHIARWKALVVVTYDTLPGETHRLWYHITHCQVKYTGCGTVWHIAMWNTWQCVIRYHDQCISHGNVSYGTTTSVFHLAMYHMLPRPVPFIWQCVLRYRLVVVLHSTLPGEIHWLWYRRTHCQLKYTGCGTA
jgi:TPP-dependent trihydroxycyclohexane-1,2-dione (THcHDO) dehydratase